MEKCVWPLFVYLFARSTQAANEAIDHLNGTEQSLQTVGYHQSNEQSHVELHHFLGLQALHPQLRVSQVGDVTMQKKRMINDQNFIM